MCLNASTQHTHMFFERSLNVNSPFPNSLLYHLSTSNPFNLSFLFPYSPLTLYQRMLSPLSSNCPPPKPHLISRPLWVLQINTHIWWFKAKIHECESTHEVCLSGSGLCQNKCFQLHPFTCKLHFPNSCTILHWVNKPQFLLFIYQLIVS